MSIAGKRPARKGQLPNTGVWSREGVATPGGTGTDHSPLELLPTPAHVLCFIPHQVKDCTSHLLLKGPSSPTDTQPAGSHR